MMCRSAHYGQGKKMQDDSWKNIGDDIIRRLSCGDLHDEVQTLSFKGKLMTKQGWRMLAQVLPKLTTCFVLDLRYCGISNVKPLIEMMPNLVRVCKCFDMGYNSLSTESIASLVEAMTKHFAYIRPTWLAIGDDASKATNQYFRDPLPCNPHCSRGCVHKQQSVVHVVKNLSDSRRRANKVPNTVVLKVESMHKFEKFVSDEATATPPYEQSTNSDDSVSSTSARDLSRDIDLAFRSYIQVQHSAVRCEMLELWSSLGDYIKAPLSVATRVTQKQARESYEVFRDTFGNGLTSLLVGENMYILATIENHLTFIDMSRSVQDGRLINSLGCNIDGATPLQNFGYIVEAEAHKAQPYELNTEGGEILRISLHMTDHLLSGWVVCDDSWFPLHKCKVI